MSFRTKTQEHFSSFDPLSKERENIKILKYIQKGKVLLCICIYAYQLIRTNEKVKESEIEVRNGVQNYILK